MKWKFIFFFVSRKLHTYAIFLNERVPLQMTTATEWKKKTERQSLGFFSLFYWWKCRGLRLFCALHMRKIKIYYRRNVLVGIFFLALSFSLYLSHRCCCTSLWGLSLVFQLTTLLASFLMERSNTIGKHFSNTS